VLVRGCDNRASTAIENSVTMVFFELSCWFHAAANECQAIRDLVVRRGEITPGPLPRTLISGVTCRNPVFSAAAPVLAAGIELKTSNLAVIYHAHRASVVYV
jgi:hypothetical protein